MTDREVANLQEEICRDRLDRIKVYQREIAEKNAFIGDLRDREGKLKKEVEELRNALAATKASLADADEEMSAYRVECATTTERLRAENAELKARIEAVLVFANDPEIVRKIIGK